MNKLLLGMALLAISFCVMMCQEAREAQNKRYDAEISYLMELSGVSKESLRMTGEIPQDSTNLVTADKVELGRLLFFDPRLSENDDDVSCATCHLPEHGFGAGIMPSIGFGGVGRGVDRIIYEGATKVDSPLVKSPTAINLCYNPTKRLLWAGKAGEPITEQEVERIKQFVKGQELAFRMAKTDIEGDEIVGMFIPQLNAQFEGDESQVHLGTAGHELDNLDAIRKDENMLKMFETCFADTVINIDRVAKAVAVFERTLTTKNAPFQQYLNGEDDALTIGQKKGLITFIERGCLSCHSGEALGNTGFAKLGIQNREGDKSEGMKDITGMEEHSGYYKIPQLYNLKHGNVFMHSGAYDFKTAVYAHTESNGMSVEDYEDLEDFILNGLYDEGLEERFHEDVQ